MWWGLKRECKRFVGVVIIFGIQPKHNAAAWRQRGMGRPIGDRRHEVAGRVLVSHLVQMMHVGCAQAGMSGWERRKARSWGEWEHKWGCMKGV